MKISIAAVTNKGNVRENNEDTYCISNRSLSCGEEAKSDYYEALDTGSGIQIGVFDGMGGLNGSEVASSIAANRLYELSADEKFQKPADLIVDINNRVCREMMSRKNQFGSTATVVSIGDGFLEIANVGDSRCFLLRNEKMTQISEDHTEAELLRRIGMEAELGSKKTNSENVLTQYLGVPADEFEIEPHEERMSIVAQDIILISSDGLTGMVAEEEIRQILSDTGLLVEKRDQLLEEALANGGRDNVTIVLIEIL